MKSTIILGKRGWGKSFLHARLIANVERCLTVNTLGDFPFVNHATSVDVQGLINLRHVAGQFQLHMPHLVHKYIDPNQVFSTACRLLVLWGRAKIFSEENPVMLAIDEVQTYCDRYDLPPYFTDIVNVGRHFGIHYSVNTRRYPEIHKDLIGNANEFYAGPSMDTNDMKRMEYIFGKATVAKFLSKNIPHGFLHRSEIDTVDIAIAHKGGVTYHAL